MKSEVFDVIAVDVIFLEQEPLQILTREGGLSAFKHHGFWQPKGTLRDKMYLEEL